MTRVFPLLMRVAALQAEQQTKFSMNVYRQYVPATLREAIVALQNVPATLREVFASLQHVPASVRGHIDRRRAPLFMVRISVHIFLLRRHRVRGADDIFVEIAL